MKRAILERFNKLLRIRGVAWLHLASEYVFEIDAVERRKVRLESFPSTGEITFTIYGKKNKHLYSFFVQADELIDALNELRLR